ATERQNDRRVGQKSLFETFAEASASPTAEAMPDVPAWPEPEKLKHEKEVLDFYFSSHPLAQKEKELRRYSSHTVEQLRTEEAGTEITLGGMLIQVRFDNTQKARN